ncbi:MAG TPA: FGGY family carbohydrate kinase [Solirubrobacteraceae bacterium]|nr:FGGY family carbohydrate kinase [Solirubrobacteraceae bacterium]
MSDADRVWVGLDLGTQSARAVAVSGDGSVAGSASRPLAGRRDGERHEQEPQAWWDAVCAACNEALEGVDQAHVAGVATCATSGTVLLVDDDGDPLTPGLMYDDARAAEHAAAAEAAGRALGHRIGAGWGLPKLLWLLEHEPALARGARLAHQPDVVTCRLVGREVACDSSHALKSGFDVERETWPHELLDGLGVPARLLPQVVRSGSRLGAVCQPAAAKTGLPAGTPVVAGMTDSCAAQLAAGALREGAWNSVMGTTLALKGVAAQRIVDPNGVLYCHRAPDGGWLPGGASSSGAGVLSERFGDRDLDDLGRRAQDHEAGAPLAYPLAGRGERFPFQATDAHGFVLGEPAGEAEHFAALLQGLAYVERLCLDYVSLLGAPVDGELSLTGGGTRSRYWCQLRADVLGRPVRLPEQTESAFGMAVLAAASTLGRAPADVAAAMCRTREVVEPRRDRAGRFDEPYLRLVDELERRGWLQGELAAHARARASGAAHG